MTGTQWVQLSRDIGLLKLYNVEGHPDSRVSTIFCQAVQEYAAEKAGLVGYVPALLTQSGMYAKGPPTLPADILASQEDILSNFDDAESKLQSLATAVKDLLEEWCIKRDIVKSRMVDIAAVKQENEY